MTPRPLASDRALTIAIVGGGFTGAAVAVHLAAGQPLPGGTRVVVVEPRAVIGQGLAYSTEDPAHRVNVPAGKMTLFPDKPADFETYLATAGTAAQDAALMGRDGQPYPHRATFGAYVASHVAPLLAAGRIEHWRTELDQLTPEPRGYRLKGADGDVLRADLVVLAVSHPAPSLPRALLAVRDDPKLIADVTKPGALAPVEPHDRVLILGNGLTSADVIATLARQGHEGPITTLSRRGLRSRGHAALGQELFGDFVTPPAGTARALLRRIRRAIAEAAAEGRSWHAVIDAVRAQGQAVWADLPLGEQRRIVRHLRPFWDVHRFRIAPQVEDTVLAALSAGRLQVVAGSVSAVARAPHGFLVTLRERHVREARAIEVDAIVVTTGPAHGSILDSQELLRGLAEDGLLRPCPTGLGILCDRNAHPLASDGGPVDDLFIAGPLARGTFGELMGLPQVTEHAVFIAGQLRDRVARRALGASAA
ncbi:FAD/NAD(P)-binding protein [Rhizobium sp. YIM 134829]|uniref:FAD/NAD(P)-binding protein n=1 Tax=Rhizobium sp. YIM 134829 TaxID=3390453 RepID=UPI00397C87E8